jgi:DNA-binding GntR family transcriptional regulator
MPLLLRERIYQDLKGNIISGLLPTGEVLSVDGLAAKYQASQTPVREALRLLQHEQFVEIIPRIGCYVSYLSLQDVGALFEFRLIVEGAAARLAAQRIKAEETAALEQLNRGYRSGDVDSYWEYLRRNREFHYRIACATGNRWLARAVGSLLDQMQRLMFLRLDLGDAAEEIVEEHRQLVAALRQRDSALAEQAMVNSIENARKAVIEAIMGGARLPLEPANH